MRRAPTLRLPRRGMASLELVLVFPMLLAIVAALFLIGQADVAKLAAATKARQQTWKGRTTAPTGPDMLRPWHDPQGSKFPAASQALQSVQISAGPIFRGQNLQGLSANTIVANTWANTPGAQGIPFPSLQKNMVPHTDALGLIGTQDVTQGVFAGFQLAFDPGMDSGGNPLLQAARGTGIGLNVGVKIAGAALEYPTGATIHAFFSLVDKAWSILDKITFGFAGHTSLGKKIKKTLDTITSYLDFFHNLYEASVGLPGNDPYTDN